MELSHHPCSAEGCGYCEKREDQEVECQSRRVKCGTVGPGGTPDGWGSLAVDVAVWRHQQGKDSDIKPVLEWVGAQQQPQVKRWPCFLVP